MDRVQDWRRWFATPLDSSEQQFETVPDGRASPA